MSFSVFPCFIMNFIAVIWPVHFRRPLYTCRQHTIKQQVSQQLSYRAVELRRMATIECRVVRPCHMAWLLSRG